jgi:hypothetical protein
MTQTPAIFEDMFEGLFDDMAADFVLVDSPTLNLMTIGANVEHLIEVFFNDAWDHEVELSFTSIARAATNAIILRTGETAYDVWDRATVLCAAKQRAYGPNNIALFGTPGVVLRMSDKNERLKNLINNGGTATADESIDDTYIDLVNYSAIGIATHRGWWTRENCPRLRSA